MPLNDHSKWTADIGDALKTVAEKLHIDLDQWSRHYSPQDLLYILNHCPFLQIVNSNPTPNDSHPAKIIKADSGWNILDYGNALSTSPGDFLWDDGTRNPGKGTLVNQAFNSVKQMIEIAVQNGWKSIDIVDGTPNMQRNAWICADEFRIRLRGFLPSDEDLKTKERVERSSSDWESLRHTISTGPSSTPTA